MINYLFLRLPSFSIRHRRICRIFRYSIFLWCRQNERTPKWIVNHIWDEISLEFNSISFSSFILSFLYIRDGENNHVIRSIFHFVSIVYVYCMSNGSTLWSVSQESAFVCRLGAINCRKWKSKWWALIWEWKKSNLSNTHQLRSIYIL